MAKVTTIFTETVWPYDPEAAKTIECYGGKIGRFKVFMWRDAKRVNDKRFSFTICDEMTGLSPHSELRAAIDYTRDYMNKHIL
jgi:hypothetical protein